MPTPTITIDEDKCRRDGLCAAVCPLGIIAPGGRDAAPRPVAEMLGWCIGCGHCVAVCPTEALQHPAMPVGDCETLSAAKWPPLLALFDLPEGHRLQGALVVGKPRLAFKRIPLRKKPAIVWRSPNKF